MKLSDGLSLQCENFWGNPILAKEIGLVESLIVSRLIWKQERWGDWVEHTQQDFENALGVSPCMQRRAVGVLKAMKILEVKQIRLQHRTFYRVCKEALNILEDSILERLSQAKIRGGSSSPEVRKPHLEDELRKANLPKLGNRISSKVQNGTVEQEEQEWENVDSDESTPLLEGSDSDSPEAPEAPPQDEAPTPPPSEGARRTPRMPPPRGTEAGAPMTRRDAGTDEEADPPAKTLPRKPQEAGARVTGVGLTPKTVIEAWNEMAEVNGLPKAMTVTKGRAKAFAARFKDAFWVQLWREAIDEIPKDPFRRGHNDRGWKADIDYFLQPDRVAKLIEQRQTQPATAQPPPTAGRSSKCPHPPGSPEWEKWYLANG